MTKKRFQKLTRAYFTRLNEWAKANGSTPMKNMGKLYSQLEKLATDVCCDDETGKQMTRAEWWSIMRKGNTFGVGVKGSK